MAWAEGRLTQATINASVTGTCTIRDADPTWQVSGADGSAMEISRPTPSRITFHAEAGQVYSVTPIP